MRVYLFINVQLSENGGEKEESCEPLSVAGKSSSAESVQLHSGSNSESNFVLTVRRDFNISRTSCFEKTSLKLISKELF